MLVNTRINSTSLKKLRQDRSCSDGVEQITPDTLIKPELITSDPHSILMQTRATDKYELAKEMNAYFKDELEINTWADH